MSAVGDFLNAGEQKAEVVFRRIRNRIVPIKIRRRVREKRPHLKEGAVSVAAGVGISVGAGKAYKETVTRSARVAFKATSKLEDIRARLKTLSKGTQLELEEIAKLARQTRANTRALRYASHASRAAEVIRKVQGPVGVGLTAYGLAKIGHALTDRDQRDRVSSGSFVAAGALSSGSFIVGMHGREGVKYLRDQAKTVMPRVKPYLSKILKARL